MTHPAGTRVGQFVRRSLLGGIVVLLPIAVIGFFFKWLYQSITDVIAPLTGVLIQLVGLPRPAADWVVVAVLVLFCFMVGHLVTTRFGGWLWQRMENGLMARLPGYRAVRDIIAQLLGGKADSALSRAEVARVWLYGRDVDVSVTALVTSHHDDGHMTVFVPTAPNPTSGFIYHVNAELVTLYPDVGVDRMMRTVLACGAGSGRFFQEADPVRGEAISGDR